MNAAKIDAANMVPVDAKSAQSISDDEECKGLERRPDGCSRKNCVRPYQPCGDHVRPPSSDRRVGAGGTADKASTSRTRSLRVEAPAGAVPGASGMASSPNAPPFGVPGGP